MGRFRSPGVPLGIQRVLAILWLSTVDILSIQPSLGGPPEKGNVNIADRSNRNKRHFVRFDER